MALISLREIARWLGRATTPALAVRLSVIIVPNMFLMPFIDTKLLMDQKASPGNFKLSSAKSRAAGELC